MRPNLQKNNIRFLNGLLSKMFHTNILRKEHCKRSHIGKLMINCIARLFSNELVSSKVILTPWLCNTQRPFVPQETMLRTSFECKTMRRRNPVKQIMNPMRAASACIAVMVQGLSFGKEQEFYFPDEKLMVDFLDNLSPARDLFFEHASMQPDTVLMVSVALSFQMPDGSFIKNTDFLPAAVIGMGRAGTGNVRGGT